MSNTGRNSGLLWLLIGANLLFVLATSLFGLFVRLGAPVTVLFITVITILHARRRYSWTEFLVFAAIAFMVSNFYENLSILTTFPFGDYYYSDRLGPKLLLVPILIAPSYFAAGYFAWTIAHILLGRYDGPARGGDVFFIPLIASFVMVMWDMVMDPITSTILKSWIWKDGGSYFGVPFSNYMGWLLCVYSIFQLFALYLNWRKPKAATSAPVLGRGYWYQAILPFFGLSLNWALRAVTYPDAIVTDPAGQQWHSLQIYEALALVAIFTVFFVCLLSAILVSRDERAAGAV